MTAEARLAQARIPPDTVTLKRESYRRAQERQRIAEARLRDEIEHSEHVRNWAREAFAEQRRMAERCTYLYGLAARHGATDEALRGPS